MNDSSSSGMAVNSTAKHSTARAPLRSRNGPSSGETSAPRMPPIDTAPEICVRVQPNSAVIGSMKIDSVATAGPWREKPAAHTQPRMIQP